MRPLPLPAVTTSQVLSMCLTAIHDPGFEERLKAIGPLLSGTADEYDAKARTAELHLIPQVTSVGTVTRDELIILYSDHLSAKRGAARSVYDQIRNSASNKKCPLCGIGAVAVLDHHLPKAKYPDLSISPLNLIPACHFCNDTKKLAFRRSQKSRLCILTMTCATCNNSGLRRRLIAVLRPCSFTLPALRLFGPRSTRSA
jgi:hypothetical protein